MNYVERMYDYVYTLPTLTNGTKFVDGAAVLRLDAEAPFALRGRAIYSEGGSAHQASTLAVKTRFMTAQSRYTSNAEWPALIDMMFAGYNGIFSPVRPQLIYPAAGIIQQSINNASGSDLTNFMMIYRGVKIFPPGGALVRQLPNVRVKIETRSYSQTVVIGATETRSRIPFNVGADSDFILRAIQVGTQSSPRYSSLMIQLRDSQQKPYSSAPIPLDYLAGNASAAVNNAGNGQNVQVGNWIPGLIMPELYLLRGETLFFDLIRNDGGGVSNTLTFNWIGAKVTAG